MAFDHNHNCRCRSTNHSSKTALFRQLLSMSNHRMTDDALMRIKQHTVVASFEKQQCCRHSSICFELKCSHFILVETTYRNVCGLKPQRDLPNDNLRDCWAARGLKCSRGLGALKMLNASSYTTLTSHHLHLPKSLGTFQNTRPYSWNSDVVTWSKKK